MARDIFTDIYHQNGWGDSESRSGNGSTLQATAMIRAALPDLLAKYHIKSMLDIPCGDLNWVTKIAGFKDLEYIGADIVDELIFDNLVTRQLEGLDLRVLDIVNDELPNVDLVMVRDLFGHLPKVEVRQALANIKQSGSRYLLTTTWPSFDDEEPREFEKGQWRHVNLEQGYSLGTPLQYVIDGFELENGEVFDSKQLGLWEINRGN